MPDEERGERSPAAQEASRRNGAKSRGPTTAKGKATSAKNALKHGLRVRQAVRPEHLPGWVRAIEANLVEAAGATSLQQREELDRLLQLLVLIDRADALIVAELARLLPTASEQDLGCGTFSSMARGEDLDAATLRKVIAYRKRFRGERDQCIRRIIAH